MTPIRVILVLAAVAAVTDALAAPPVVGKAKRLVPEDPKPVSLSVPQEPKVEIAGSCKLGGSACADYQGSFAGVDLQALCASAKGTFNTSPCPTEGAVGTCTQRQENSEDRILTRTYPPGTADAARKTCVNLPRGIFLKAN